MSFVTLTQPRIPGEALASTVRRFDAAWRRLRKLPQFASVAGGLRVLEVTHSPQGWHVHAHCIVETFAVSRRVACPTCRGAGRVPTSVGGRWVTRACRSCSSSTQPGDGGMQADLAELVRTWAMLADCRDREGSLTTKGQCAVPLDDANAGQLAKYLSKLWELDDGSARELFRVFAQKRLVQTWGCWYRCVRLGPRKPTGRQWFRGHFVADIERMHPRSYVEFHGTTSLRFEPFSHGWRDATAAATERRADVHVRGVDDKGARAWRPALPVHRMTAGAFLRALRADDRRADEHPEAPPNTPTPGADSLRAPRVPTRWRRRFLTRWILGVHKGPVHATPLRLPASVEACSAPS
jgi:hypothetical protein